MAVTTSSDVLMMCRKKIAIMFLNNKKRNITTYTPKETIGIWHNHNSEASLIGVMSLTNSCSKTRLAPLYDVLSTTYYPDLAKKMAMNMLPKHFDQLADEAGLAKPMVKRRVQKLAETAQTISVFRYKEQITYERMVMRGRHHNQHRFFFRQIKGTKLNCPVSADCTDFRKLNLC